MYDPKSAMVPLRPNQRIAVVMLPTSMLSRVKVLFASTFPLREEHAAE
jgi:hypothetical protein